MTRVQVIELNSKQFQTDEKRIAYDKIDGMYGK